MKFPSLACPLALAATLLPGLAHGAWTYRVLYNFTGGADGDHPQCQLIEDKQGNLYGTTASGGISPPSQVGPQYGVLFKLAPDGTETVLYEFGTGKHGANPRAGVVADAQGNMYGTTASGGPTYNGAVFRVTTTGRAKMLHYFSGAPSDGALPEGSLLALPKGIYAGTTYSGGSAGAGTIFSLGQTGTGYRVLTSFTGTATGTNPASNLIRDGAGNIYGTTSGGGSHGDGALFELNAAGTLSLLYSFAGGNDGSEPFGGVMRDAAGNLYGVTYTGGHPDFGTVFKVAPGGAETVLHSFAGSPKDGSFPYGGLIEDKSGNIYGTTSQGGPDYQGIVFEIAAAGGLTILHSFSGADGGAPLAPLLLDKKGNLYGTASLGGTSNSGVVFELSP